VIARVRRLCRGAALEACAASGVDPALIGWENRPAVPPADGRPWGTETLRLGPEELGGAGAGPALRSTIARPLYALTLQAPVDEGTGDLDALTDAFAVAFRPGRTLVASDDPDDQRYVRLDCETVDLAPVAPGIAAGWAARAVRVGLVARRLVDATGAPVAFAPPPRVFAPLSAA